MPIPSTRAELIAMADEDHDPSVVEIDRSRLGDIQWMPGTVQPMVLRLDGRVAASAADTLAFVLVETAINYRFWRVKDSSIVRYQHAGRTGAHALWGAFCTAWGRDEASPHRLRMALAEGGVSGVFGDIPDPEGRRRILDEMLAGREIENYCAAVVRQGRLLTKVTVGDASALARRFPVAFGDDPYLKKAQLAMAIFSACARGSGVSHDSTNLTAFADYQVPRVLRAMGVLRYAKDLADAVDSLRPLPSGSAAERAIRAATVLACEEIAALTATTAADVDNQLWRHKDSRAGMPFHLTETTWY